MNTRFKDILGNEQGVTLIEALISSIVIVVTILTIFIGIIFAEKQLTRNYHDRIATLHASGELDWQYYYHKVYNRFDSTISQEIIMDQLPRRRTLKGRMNTTVKTDGELVGARILTYDVLTVKVSWVEPGDNKQRFIELKEEFYR